MKMPVKLWTEDARNHPFYRWLSHEKTGISTDLCFSKNMLFQYEGIRGLSYYEPLTLPSTTFEFRSTSGSTGRPLRILWTHVERALFFGGIIASIYRDDANGSGRIVYNMPSGKPPDAYSSLFNTLSLADRLSIDRFVHATTELGASVLIDHTEGTWLVRLLQEGLDLKHTPLRVIVSYPNEGLFKRITEQGVHYRSVFGCMEGGLFALSCIRDIHSYHLIDFNRHLDSPLLQSMFPRSYRAFYSIPVDPFSVQVAIQGQIAEEGAGALCLTRFGQGFSWLNYLPGDEIVLMKDSICRCGYHGASFNFLRRTNNQVKIPNIYGLFFDLDKVRKTLLGDPSIHNVGLVVVEISPTTAILVAIAEDYSISASRVDTVLRDVICREGTGQLVSREDQTSFLAQLPPNSAVGYRGVSDMPDSMYDNAIHQFVWAFRVPPGSLPMPAATGSFKSPRTAKIPYPFTVGNPYKAILEQLWGSIDVSSFMIAPIEDRIL